MTDFDKYISRATRVRSPKPLATDSAFATVHMRIHKDIYQLLRNEAHENGISIPAALEYILATRYKERLSNQDKVRTELGESESIED